MEGDRQWNRAGLIGALVLIVAAALSLLSLRPPAPVSASADASRFSAERAWPDLERIATEAHPLGSDAHTHVRTHLVERLQAMGADVRVVRGAVAGDPRAAALQNIVAVVPGTDPTGSVALVTHYDSHPRAPGAGDDGLAVAAMLETMRVLGTLRPLRNDLVFLFTDGEELGLLGARMFMESDPRAPDVRVALNFEGRGSHGPALMFETGPGNAELVRIFAAADPRPIASSLFPEAYRYLPNNTDFTVFMRAGVRGLNFAHIGHAETYHRETDVPANASAATLQHHGEHAVAMARAFGDLDLAALPGADEAGDVVYFNLPPFGLIRYPVGLALPHAVLSALLLLGAMVLARRRRGARIAGMAMGAVLFVVLLLVGVGAGLLASTVAGMQADAGTLVGKFVRQEAPYMLAIVTLTVAAMAVGVRFAGNRLGAPAVVLGMLAGPALVALAAAAIVPGASYLFAWTTAFAALAGAVVASSAPGRTVSATLLLLPVVAIWAPHLSLFLTGLTLRMAPVLGVLAAVAAVLLAPATALLVPVEDRKPARASLR